MTIDELFGMPICKMNDWLSENYRDPKGYFKKEYWFTDIKECFGVEFPEGCGWRIIPCMSTYKDKDTLPLDKIKKSGYDHLEVAVAKVSKYGECLVYRISGEFSHHDVRKKYDKPQYGFTEYIDRQYTYEISKIFCEDIDHGGCRIYIDGKDIVNNSELGVHFRLSDSGDYHNKWLDEFEFLDKYYSVGFNGKPILSTPYKNKHSLNEFANKLENYAKKVSEYGVKAYNDNLSIINDNEFIKNCKSVHLKPTEVFDLWLALYIENQTVTFNDIFGMIKLSESTEKLVEEYVKKCKCTYLRKDYDGKYRITLSPYYNCYNVCLLYGRKCFTITEGFTGYLKDLNKTREMYNSLGSYKDTVKYAKTAYQTNYKLMAQTFENKIINIYNEVFDKLESVKNEYLESSKEIYNDIHEKYPGVNDIDVGIYKDIPDIVDSIHKDFERISVKLMKNIYPKYKGLINKKIKTKTTKENNDDKELLDHCKKLFDAAPNLKKIVYYSVYKAYDAPYEVYESDLDDFNIDEESIYDYEEKYGQDSFNEWVEEFERLMPSGPSDYHSIGQELYPGCHYNMFINRKLEYDEEDNVD